MSGTHQTCHYKLVLLGDTAVGKSCLVVRFVRDEFFEFQEPTIGAAFLTQRLVLDNTTVKFEIWDTAGTRACTFSAALLCVGRDELFRSAGPTAGSSLLLH